VLDVLDADQAESGRWRRRFGRGVKGPKPVWRGSSSGNPKSRILTHDLCFCCCGVGVVGLAAPVLALVVESALESGSGGLADVAGVEFGRERVEEQRESAPEARREVAGEGGAGREEVRELREDLRPSRGDDLAGSVGAGEEVEGGEDGWMIVVGVFWLLARGVVGDDSERGTSSTPFESTLGGTVAHGGCEVDSGLSTDSDCRVAGEAGTRGSAPTPPLTLRLLRQITSWSDPRPETSAPLTFLSSPAAGFLSCDTVVDGLPAARPAAVTVGAAGWAEGGADSWLLLPILFPAFILESVDLRLVVDDITAYSCGERMGGGKKGEPGEGKGDEEIDNLLTVTVSEGVVSGRQ
jgi:hypothetical protein